MLGLTKRCKVSGSVQYGIGGQSTASSLNRMSIYPDYEPSNMNTDSIGEQALVSGLPHDGVCVQPCPAMTDECAAPPSQLQQVQHS